ncbi:hypothetical protein [Synechocystis sp. LKSZ1]|uniref:salt stress protein, Slr1339 family n=1 Tax=Synechocystis sp. LKSZ1 TaxID=3144951 RepID=UPI00336BE714
MDSVESLLAELRHQYSSPAAKDLGVTPPETKAPSPASLDQLLASLEAFGPAVSSSPVAPAPGPNPEIQGLLRQQQQAQQQQIMAQAQAWLEKLDPLSSEGLWFTEFAKKYPSPLLAAMELLQHQER